MIKILIVDDEKSICDLIDINLSAAGYHCRSVQDGLEAIDLIESENFDLILLDIMLPGEDGIAILKKLRMQSATENIPVIMATARGTEYDKVTGLDAGADDYLAKPFGMMEMVSRVKAVLRRSAPKQDREVLAANDLVLNVAEHTVTAGGKRVALTFKEFELLRMFLSAPGVAFTREKLLDAIWDAEYLGETRTVDIHIRTLRQKLGSYGEMIETVRNVGYRLEVN